jgi:hypothetical protein
MSTRCYVFLDFDGVLRRSTSPHSRLDSDCVALLEECVLRHPDVRVVIASTWRHAFSLKQLKALFSPAFADRIAGITPDLSTETDEHLRYAEIREYLSEAGVAGAAWVAVDDDPEQFRPGAPLIVVDSSKGFDASAARELQKRISASAATVA